MRKSNERNSKKRVAAIAILTLILVGGGGAGAYAYWSTGGTGTGTATTGTTTNISAVQTGPAITGIAPGSGAQTLSGNFNNTNSGPVYVTNVVASFTVTKSASAVAGSCDATDYTLTGATMAVGAQVAAGSGTGAWTGATIAFNNKATNQDACKGATLNFTYAVN